MSNKPSAAEQAFAEYWAIFGVPSHRAGARRAYLAATERTARRCVEICQEMRGDRVRLECARAIAKEFGLD